MADVFDGAGSLLKVAQLGNPILRQIAQPLTQEELADPKTQFFIDSMIASMPEYSAAGFAAPQFHLSKKIIAIEGTENNPRYPERGSIPKTILINPEIKKFSDEIKAGTEGCISVKGLWGEVKRSTAITVEGWTREGKEVTIDAEGFYAVVLQHEIDHLYGTLFIDRMENMSTLAFTSEHNRFQI